MPRQTVLTRMVVAWPVLSLRLSRTHWKDWFLLNIHGLDLLEILPQILGGRGNVDPPILIHTGKKRILNRHQIEIVSQ